MGVEEGNIRVEDASERLVAMGSTTVINDKSVAIYAGPKVESTYAERKLVLDGIPLALGIPAEALGAGIVRTRDGKAVKAGFAWQHRHPVVAIDVGQNLRRKEEKPDKRKQKSTDAHLRM